MIEIYNILTWGTFWLMSLSALFLLTVSVPNRSDLRNYKKMRYLLAYGVYVLMAAINLIEFTTGEGDIWYSRVMTLWISCCLAPLLSVVNITLINPHILTSRKLARSLILPIIFTGVNIWMLERFTIHSTIFITTFLLFVAYYVFVLIKYTILFLNNYKDYGSRLNDYYSDPDGGHLQWVAVSQFIATGSGVMALAHLFMPPFGMCVFALFLDIFYPYYAIRFINYAFHFPTIAPILEEVHENLVPTELNSHLEKSVSEWERQKGFLQGSLNIEVVSRELGTNRTYLSSYINTYKGKNFKEWVSDLRIAEAQHLLLTEPETPVYEIASRVGFTDKGNFTNRFSKSTGVSPSKWRKMQLGQA